MINICLLKCSFCWPFVQMHEYHWQTDRGKSIEWRGIISGIKNYNEIQWGRLSLEEF